MLTFFLFPNDWYFGVTEKSFLADMSLDSDVWWRSILWNTELFSHYSWRSGIPASETVPWQNLFSYKPTDLTLTSEQPLCCSAKNPGNLSNPHCCCAGGQEENCLELSAIATVPWTAHFLASNFPWKTILLGKNSEQMLREFLCKWAEKWWLCWSTAGRTKYLLVTGDTLICCSASSHLVRCSGGYLFNGNGHTL